MEQNEYSPIVIFAFNRLEELRHTVAAVLQNKEAADSDLFVFVDGARPQKEGEQEKVLNVQKYIKTISGFKTVHFTFSDNNKGLAESIITGVTEIINKFGRVIVLEDDLVVARGFLSYMNKMLDSYKDDKRIMQISGFSTKLRLPHGYPYDIYLNRRGESWSWATWKDRWDTVDWVIKDFDAIKKNNKERRAFNDIGSDLYGMLASSVKTGHIWAVKFAYAMFKQNAYQVSPIRSLVKNDGFNGDSTNCNVYNRYKYEFNEEQTDFEAPQNISYNRKIDKSANRYWSIRYRIYGKIMTCIYKIFK